MSTGSRIQAVIHHDGDDVAMAVVDGIEVGHCLSCWTTDRDEMISLTADCAIPLGHKVALRDIKMGQEVVKYGSSIGRASADIRAGEHVHIQNLRSTRW